jgi:hypothetical protein
MTRYILNLGFRRLLLEEFRFFLVAQHLRPEKKTKKGRSDKYDFAVRRKRLLWADIRQRIAQAGAFIYSAHAPGL